MISLFSGMAFASLPPAGGPRAPLTPLPLPPLSSHAAALLRTSLWTKTSFSLVLFLIISTWSGRQAFSWKTSPFSVTFAIVRRRRGQAQTISFKGIFGGEAERGKSQTFLHNVDSLLHFSSKKSKFSTKKPLVIIFATPMESWPRIHDYFFKFRQFRTSLLHSLHVMNCYFNPYPADTFLTAVVTCGTLWTTVHWNKNTFALIADGSASFTRPSRLSCRVVVLWLTPPRYRSVRHGLSRNMGSAAHKVDKWEVSGFFQHSFANSYTFPSIQAANCCIWNTMPARVPLDRITSHTWTQCVRFCRVQTPWKCELGSSSSFSKLGCPWLQHFFVFFFLFLFFFFFWCKSMFTHWMWKVSFQSRVTGFRDWRSDSIKIKQIATRFFLYCIIVRAKIIMLHPHPHNSKTLGHYSTNFAGFQTV